MSAASLLVSRNPHSSAATNTDQPRLPTSPVLILLVVSMLLPEELSFIISNLRLTVARIILILIAPYVCVHFAGIARRQDFRLALSDIYFPLAGLWMMVSVGAMQGVEMAIASAGIQTVEFSLAYLTARVLVRQDDDALAVIRTSCICTSLVALLSVLDALYGRFVVHDWFGALTGYVRTSRLIFGGAICGPPGRWSTQFC